MTDTPKFSPTAADKAWMKTNHRIGWHPQGGWCRKFPGDTNRTYFGWILPADAIREHNAEEARRSGNAEAERLAETKIAAYTVREAVNLFLRAQDERLARGDISPTQRARYGSELAIFAAGVGGARKLSDLTKLSAPDAIFTPLRSAAVARGLSSGEKHIIIVRTFLKWASDVRRFMTAPFYGGAFSVPSKKERHAAKKAIRKAKGVAFWEPAEVREIVEAARGVNLHFYAQVLLMINGGMGATDLANLEDADFDWTRRCIHTDRSKTLVPRVVPLWDLTIEAVKASRASRPAAADAVWSDRVFLTRAGKPIVHKTLNAAKTKLVGSDTVKNRMYVLLNGEKRNGKLFPGKLGHLKRHGAGAYTLRACFSSLALGQSAELIAVIMGHKFQNEVSEWYARGDFLERLRVVTEHVRLQLWEPQSSEAERRKSLDRL